MVSLNPFFPSEVDYRVTNSQRAFIKNEDTGEEFTVMFNPEGYSYKLSADDKEGNEKDEDVLTVTGGDVTASSESVDLPFHSTGIGDLDITLQYHAYTSSIDIRSEMMKIQELTLPTQSSGSVRRRPECSFNWEEFYYLGYITEAEAKYTMFDSDGKPLRAELSLNFKAIIPEKDKNKYSGFEGCRKTWIVKGNDRLDLIANAIYQDAKQWLFIARENDIDNPIKFPTPNDIGRVLILPDLPT
ncbi:CIS tube protein [Candidatus Uabimicrobium amorphum]|uniref:Peptidoglycan-binding protein n=1 Tax=Uabimicrobium amorphum TaxID=2596890 RepID=A0A5S9ITV7_UABAM|nr:hypothetical protein [Candidatus Uabimicrobium amorphum]BBM87989.1 peptidoglycan-binding protein [Candidatus Uabimicrobium amorphum]